MRRVMALLLAFLLIGGCGTKQKKVKEGPTPELMGGQPVTVELVTGDILRLELMMEESDAYLMKGRAGTGRFPKVLVRQISEAQPEGPVGDLPGKDLLRKKIVPKYVAKIGGQTFHTLNCRQARYIDGSDRIEFETREEALQRGLRPCGVCNP